VSVAAAVQVVWTRFRDFVNRVGPYSPFVTGGIFSPGARRLLAQAEAGAERVLHLFRLVVLVVGSAIGFLWVGLIDLVPIAWPLFAVAVVAVTALWIYVWRRLERGAGFGFRTGLIFFDAFVIDRGILLFHNPAGLYTIMRPDLHEAALRLISPGMIDATTPPMLVLLALGGALRLDPRLALVSTAVSLAVYAHLRAVFPAPALQTWPVALIIGVSGLLGANAARVFRYVTWKAGEEEVLERYVTQALTDELARSGDPERAGRIETITVLMADIRGFTTLSERLLPAEAVRLLNECFEAIVAPIGRAGGILDKYIGDGLLAFFEGPEHAGRALRAGRDMLAALDVFNAPRVDGARLRIGVAIHAGSTLLGTVGAAGRRDYTIIGDVVNVTARLEECNKRLDSTLIVSEAAFALIDGAAADGLVGPTPIELRGREEGVRVRYIERPRTL
jgi:adenylate cyclase